MWDFHGENKMNAGCQAGVMFARWSMQRKALREQYIRRPERAKSAVRNFISKNSFSRLYHIVMESKEARHYHAAKYALGKISN